MFLTAGITVFGKRNVYKNTDLRVFFGEQVGYVWCLSPLTRVYSQTP